MFRFLLRMMVVAVMVGGLAYFFMGYKTFRIQIPLEHLRERAHTTIRNGLEKINALNDKYLGVASYTTAVVPVAAAVTSAARAPSIQPRVLAPTQKVILKKTPAPAKNGTVKHGAKRSPNPHALHP
jgi:hypothetical protein